MQELVGIAFAMCFELTEIGYHKYKGHDKSLFTLRSYSDHVYVGEEQDHNTTERHKTYK